MAASPNIVSHGDSMIFTQSEATAAQRTWLFYLSNSADGTPATGKTIAGSDFLISKNGAAFANAAGTVTELSLGWYIMVFAAADLDTIGALACELSVEAGVDTLHVVHQVTLFDLNTATAPLATDAIGSAQLAATAASEIVTALQTAQTTGGATRTVSKNFGPTYPLEADGSTYLGMDGALDMVVSLSGTWDGATVTLTTSQNPEAGVGAVWSAVSGGAFTADGDKTITGPFKAVRATMTNDGAASEVRVTGAIRFPA